MALMKPTRRGEETKLVRKTGPVVGTNARGGIDKVSNREARGEVAQGSTGQVGTSSFKSGGGGKTAPAPAPAQDQATDVGVVSTDQGATTLKQEAAEIQRLERSGRGTKEEPLDATQLQDLASQGIQVGDEVPGKGKLLEGGYFAPTQEVAPTPTGPEISTTYINPETGATETTTGTGSGSQEERDRYAGMGMQVSESTTVSEEPKSEAEKELEKELKDMTDEVESYKSQLMDLIITDSELRADIRGITKAYDARIAEMQDITRRQVQGVKTLGYRMGAQFTGGMGGMWGGIISDAERQGLMKIAEIEGDKQSKIIEAKTAARNNNYQIYAALMDDARDLQQKKADELAALRKAQKEQDAKIAERKNAIDRQYQIAELYADGITDPADIMQMLNTGPNGEALYTATIDEVKTALDIINPPDKYKNAGTDFNEWMYRKQMGDIPESMTLEQYRAMVKRANESDKPLSDSEKLGLAIGKAVSSFTGIDPETGERIPIPGVELNGQPVYFVGEDGYLGSPGLRYTINEAQLNDIDTIPLLEAISRFINPDHKNPRDLTYGYGLDMRQIEAVTGIKTVEYGDYEDGEIPDLYTIHGGGGGVIELSDVVQDSVPTNQYGATTGVPNIGVDNKNTRPDMSRRGNGGRGRSTSAPEPEETTPPGRAGGGGRR